MGGGKREEAHLRRGINGGVRGRRLARVLPLSLRIHVVVPPKLELPHAGWPIAGAPAPAGDGRAVPQAIGTMTSRPMTTRIASRSSTTFTGRRVASPRDTWQMIANT